MAVLLQLPPVPHEPVPRLFFLVLSELALRDVVFQLLHEMLALGQLPVEHKEIVSLAAPDRQVLLGRLLLFGLEDPLDLGYFFQPAYRTF